MHFVQTNPAVEVLNVGCTLLLVLKKLNKKLTIKSICCDSDGRTLRWVVKKRKAFVEMCLKYGETF